MNTRFNATPDAITSARVADLNRQARIATATAETLAAWGDPDGTVPALILDALQLAAEAAALGVEE